MSTIGATWSLICPQCRGPLGDLPSGPEGPFEVGCADCGIDFRRRSGVWDFLPPARAAQIEPFLAEYTAVRRAEGRADLAPDAIRALPWADADDPRAWEWYIRATSFEHLVATVIPPPGAVGLRVIDLGAGVGWLSHRLAEAGHDPVAIDVSDDPGDGLGAARHFDAVLPRPFPRLRAEFDRLPLAGGQADFVIFNASFHYSADYAATLAEALRVLAPGGAVVILDSPIYGRAESGERMVAARKAAFTARYGFPSDRLGSREFLVEAELGRLGRELGLRWGVYVPRYGLSWTLRRWYRRLRTGRESARFEILVARRDDGR